MITDPELDNELADDIALEADTDADDIDGSAEGNDDEEANEGDALQEAQADAAEERKEGGYQ